MVDPNEYLGEKPTAYSHVYLEYEPSPALNESLRGFIKPHLRLEKRFAQIALRSESFFEAPIVNGGQALQHSSEVTKYLYAYQGRLDEIKDRQLRLAAFVDMRILDKKGLTFHFEMLPDELERRRLGRLALKYSDPENEQAEDRFGLVAHIPYDAIHDPYGEATRKLRGLLATSHPAVQGKQHDIPAPLANGLWVKKPVLRDRNVPNIVGKHPDIQQD